MSIQIISTVLKVQLGNPSRKVVAIKLADCASDDGSGIWASVARIAAETELSIRTVQYVLREFEAEGLLTVTARGGKGGSGKRTTTTYAINLEKLAALPVVVWKDAESQNGGAKSAPQKARGATAAPEGCNSCTPGGATAAPKPLVTVKEPSHRAKARRGGGSNRDPEVKAGPLPKPQPEKTAMDITAEVFAQARELCPGRDVHELHQEWKDWSDAQDEPVANPAAAFLAFCKRKGPLKGSGFKCSADLSKPLPEYLTPRAGEVAIGRGTAAWDQWLYWADKHTPEIAKSMRSSRTFTIFAVHQYPHAGIAAPRVPQPETRRTAA